MAAVQATTPYRVTGWTPGPGAEAAALAPECRDGPSPFEEEHFRPFVNYWWAEAQKAGHAAMTVTRQRPDGVWEPAFACVRVEDPAHPAHIAIRYLGLDGAAPDAPEVTIVPLAPVETPDGPAPGPLHPVVLRGGLEAFVEYAKKLSEEAASAPPAP